MGQSFNFPIPHQRSELLSSLDSSLGREDPEIRFHHTPHLNLFLRQRQINGTGSIIISKPFAFLVDRPFQFDALTL
jgi:hypothetical protein